MSSRCPTTSLFPCCRTTAAQPLIGNEERRVCFRRGRCHHAGQSTAHEHPTWLKAAPPSIAIVRDCSGPQGKMSYYGTPNTHWFARDVTLVSNLAQAGAPVPWKRPLRIHSVTNQARWDPIPKTAFVAAVANKPNASIWLGFRRSPSTPATSCA